MRVVLGCTGRACDTLTDSGYHIAEGDVNLRRRFVGEIAFVQDLDSWDAAADYDYE